MREPKLLNIGFKNMVVASRVVAILSPGPASVKRIRDEARERGQLLDATLGRKTRTIIVTDSGHVILSAFQPDTIAQRFDSASSERKTLEQEEARGI